MNILLLARNPKLYSHQRLLEAAINRGHNLEIKDTLSFYMKVNQTSMTIWNKDVKIDEYNAVIPRIGASITHYGAALVRHFELKGVYTVNTSSAILNSRDKFWSLQLLANHNISIPTTVYSHSSEHTKMVIEKVGGAPLIIKLLEGTQGLGVVLAQSNSNAENLIEAFKGVKANIMVQEYIKEASGSDIRCFVVGDEVVAAMERKAMKEGEFRANIHRGGVGKSVELTDEEIDLAVKSSKIMGLGVSGVDILRSKKGSMVIEVNSSPGLQGIEDVTGVDVADKIIAYIEQKTN